LHHDHAARIARCHAMVREGAPMADAMGAVGLE
jgi:hypothetical protein